MRHFTYKLLVMAAVMTMANLTDAAAKHVAVPKMYMFGFAASFNDSIVHFTDIQEVDSAWVESKNNFLLGRMMYSYQLRDFLKNEQLLPYRTCTVSYDTDKARLEKKFLKMKKLYTQPKNGRQTFDVRYLNSGEFRFKAVNMSEEDFTVEETPKKKAKQKRNKGGK